MVEIRGNIYFFHIGEHQAWLLGCHCSATRPFRPNVLNAHMPIVGVGSDRDISWWRHQMETFSALLAFCAVNSPVTGEFTAQRPVTRSFEVLFNQRLNKGLSTQAWGWWFETPSRPLWRHCYVKFWSQRIQIKPEKYFLQASKSATHFTEYVNIN